MPESQIEHLDSNESSLLVGSFEVYSEEELRSIYDSNKTFLSVRANNVLEQMEIEYSVLIQEEGLSSFLEQIKSGQIDVMSQRNCGRLTALELNDFFQSKEIWPAVSYLEQSEYYRTNVLISSIKRFLSDYSKEQIEKLVNGEDYEFLEVLCFALFTLNVKPIRLKIYKLYYFDEANWSQTDIAKECKITRERVRQILLDLESEVKKVSTTILNQIKGKPVGWPFFRSDDVCLVFHVKNEVAFQLFEMKPNLRFLNLLSATIEELNHFSLHYYLIESKGLRVLKDSGLQCYLLKSYLKPAGGVGEFLSWLDNEMFNLEIAQFEYSTSVLVERFFKRFDILIDNNSLKKLAEYLDNSKKDISNSSEFKKREKEIFSDQIKTIVRRKLEEEESPLKTEALLIELSNNLIEIPRYDLLKLLNHDKSNFIVFGNGLWALTDWKSEGMYGGSIRDITMRLIKEKKEPLHISKIVDYLKKYRPINQRSLITNLKAVEIDVFEFFNCGYIGLKEYKYSEYWHSLPKINRTLFRKDVLSMHQHGMAGSIEEIYESKYGYPPEHTRYLIGSEER